ncbi:Acetyltransferase GNAT family [Methanonatronarchaeum thermophilum]|uniref:Acetyltransferase GNAT family n=1 Tax=Methanonatronarchaeum thermophilum TaxID=1927129 RepID=A0A1Y3GCL1_9EURY|nr:GNAT family N-acetyltransferase [Methanonatronarchaeum thermophilum]OUJ18987.1 Acetyltransferase GNAT family [Methanonatronarchaeum thermophilum]
MGKGISIGNSESTSVSKEEFVSELEVVRAGIKELLPAWRIKEKCNQKSGMLRQDFLTFSADFSANEVYVAKLNGFVIGFIIFRRNGYISIFGVHPEYTRMGVGSTLIDKVKKELSEVWCHVRITNKTAIRFYKAVGFEKSKVVENYYSNGDNAIVMTCKTKNNGV